MLIENRCACAKTKGAVINLGSIVPDWPVSPACNWCADPLLSILFILLMTRVYSLAINFGKMIPCGL